MKERELAVKVEAAAKVKCQLFYAAFLRDSLIESMRLFAEDVMPAYK